MKRPSAPTSQEVPRRPWWQRLAIEGRQYWPGMLVLLVLLFFNVGLNALRPWPMKLIVDNVLIGHPLPTNAEWLIILPGVESGGVVSPLSLLAWLAALTVIVFLAGQALSMAQSQMALVVGLTMARGLSLKVFNKLQRLSSRFYGKHTLGDLMRRVAKDAFCVRDLLVGVALSRLAALVQLIVMVVVIWRLDRTLSLLVLVAGVPLGLISLYFHRGMTDRTLEQERLSGEMNALAEQTLTVLPIVQGFSREDEADDRYEKLTRNTLQATLRVTMRQLQLQFGTGGVRSLCVAGVMLVGGIHVLQGSLTVGSLLVILAYLNSLLGPLEGLAYASIGFATAAANARRVFEVLDADDMVREMPGARALPVRRWGEGAHVRLERVVFGYESDRPVLRDVSLEARPGEMIALVGATGAGKSTLVSLVPRFFDPWEGRVMMNGMDIREVQLKSLRDQIALVLQDAFILPLSIADNIAYGRPDATRAEIEAVARAANAHEFIERLPQGYDTVVGERGATLSGGERQRLAIARAFLKNAPLLVLDEPTSALDAGTEQQVLGALNRLIGGRTVLVIAHRLSTVRRADRIVVLEHGVIVEQGSHEELMAAAGKYSEYYQIQYSGTSDPLSGVAPAITPVTR